MERLLLLFAWQSIANRAKGKPLPGKQRISYVPVEDMTDDMQREMGRCAREGTPRPESSAVRAHVPAAFWFFANSWNDLFRNGICDHAIKELCRVYISRTVKCEYCGNQRSEKGRRLGLVEGQYDELLNFESSSRFTDRQKAALSYVEAIAWRLDTDDVFWERLYAHFTEPELVELGCAIGLTLGQQSWLRLLDIEHHEVMEGTSASMAPGFETPEALRESKAASTYWARS
ncbi:MAG: carboxymuconolactone decarboxylase family protein [Acidimicrobiales bacterium]